MTVDYKKIVKKGLSLFRRDFNSSKCKTVAKMAVARIKLLRNKRAVTVRQMRRDIAMLLESRQDATARIRVEHVIREQNILQANEILELFCELIVARLTIIAKQRECPADLKEGISSLIFAAPRCSDIPELTAIKDVFEKKYGKDFVSTATDLRPNAGVNLTLIEKLSVKRPSGEVKLKIMKEIAKEFQVEWDTTESETELLQQSEERIEGPNRFSSASSLPINPTSRVSNDGEYGVAKFGDSASAAKAAAESAKQAIEAADIAAYLATRDAYYSACKEDEMAKRPQKIDRRHSYNIPSKKSNERYDASDCDEEFDVEENPSDDDLLYRRRSYNDVLLHSGTKLDESDPPPRPAPKGRVHTGFPSDEKVAARLEFIKSGKLPR